MGNDDKKKPLIDTTRADQAHTNLKKTTEGKGKQATDLTNETAKVIDKARADRRNRRK